MRYLKYIYEKVNEDFLYHQTNPSRILNILRTNKLNLGTRINQPFTNVHQLSGKPFHLTFTRTPNAKIGHGRMELSRIVFDRNKLKNRFEILPYDSWHTGADTWSTRNVANTSAFKGKGTQKEINYELNQRYEYEEWLFYSKPSIDNAISYIERVDLLQRGNRENDQYNNNYINRVVNLCNELGIPVFVYNNRDDMSYGRNAINTPEYTDMDYHHSRNDDDFDWDAFVALILFDRKYIDNSNSGSYNMCVEDSQEYANKHNLPEINGYKVHEKMRDLSLNNKDALSSLSNHIHNFFMDGKSGKIREKIHLLTNEMKKYECRSIKELAECKVRGVRPYTLPKKDWSGTYQLGFFHQEFWGDKDSPITYKPISNENKFKSLRKFYYSTYQYGGQLDKDDFNAISKIDQDEAPISKFINYLFNKYTVKKAIEIIEKSGYDDYDKVDFYKVLKINNK